MTRSTYFLIEFYFLKPGMRQIKQSNQQITNQKISAGEPVSTNRPKYYKNVYNTSLSRNR